jgi:hypothetical protein
MFRPKERRLCESGILEYFSSIEIREEPEDDGDRSEIEGLLFEDLRDRGPFFKSGGRSKALECERKKLATRCGIARVFEANAQNAEGRLVHSE